MEKRWMIVRDVWHLSKLYTKLLNFFIIFWMLFSPFVPKNIIYNLLYFFGGRFFLHFDATYLRDCFFFLQIVQQSIAFITTAIQIYSIR